MVRTKHRRHIERYRASFVQAARAVTLELPFARLLDVGLHHICGRQYLKLSANMRSLSHNLIEFLTINTSVLHFYLSHKHNWAAEWRECIVSRLDEHGIRVYSGWKCKYSGVAKCSLVLR